MILVRNVFKLKFGTSRDAVSLWKQGLAIAGSAGLKNETTRLLTDLVGPFYTLIMESTHENLADYERVAKKLRDNEEWKVWYAKVIPLTDGGYREIFNIVD